ncbi:MAG: murein hydrolase activator EnvC family protein [Candidatus Altimarinota bacterium]
MTRLSPKKRQNREKMTKKAINSLFMGVLLLFVMLAPARSSLSLAHEGEHDVIDYFGMGQGEISETDSPTTETTIEPNIDPQVMIRQHNTHSFMEGIKTEIQYNEADLALITQTVDDTEEKLNETRLRIGTLTGQLLNLNTQIKDTEAKIENVEEQIERKEDEIKLLEYEIAVKKVEITNQKQMFLEYLEMIYKQQSDFNSINEQELQLNTLKLLFADQNAGDTLRSLKYSEILEESGRQIFGKLNVLMAEDEKNQKLMELKRRTLAQLQVSLNEEKGDLEVKKRAKGALLKQTRGEEKIYQELLESSKKQQEEVQMQVDTLRENLVFIEKKARELGPEFDPANYAALFNGIENRQILDFLNGQTGGNSEFQLRWPVSPSRGVTAYFREASYAAYFGMQHNAIDIRAYQNTPIRAPAEGIVYKAVDNGYGYSYIILAHQKGFMTVYGHVTQILVKPGQIIKAGETIGLSGATPGTLGAGVYTTGPHLHFEVIKDGKHVDPLNYLNLAYLKLESLPEKYVAKAMGDQKKVRNPGNGLTLEDAVTITEMVEMGDLSHAGKEAE